MCLCLISSHTMIPPSTSEAAAAPASAVAPLNLNWTPCAPIKSTTMIGKYVRIDPLDIDTDTPLLWDALGGNDDTINERLKWYGLAALENQDDFKTLLQTLEKPNEGWAVNVMRLLEVVPSSSSTTTTTTDSNNNDTPPPPVCGMASYISTVADHGTTEIGYVAHGLRMARTPAATEAHYLLARHAIETFGYRRYEWKCDSQNMPSKAAALRYGFQYEGCFRHHRVTALDTNRNTCWYSMLNGKEWYDCRKVEFETWLADSNFDSETQQQHKRLEDIRIELGAVTTK